MCIIEVESKLNNLIFAKAKILSRPSPTVSCVICGEPLTKGKIALELVFLRNIPRGFKAYDINGREIPKRKLVEVSYFAHAECVAENCSQKFCKSIMRSFNISSRGKKRRKLKSLFKLLMISSYRS